MKRFFLYAALVLFGGTNLFVACKTDRSKAGAAASSPASPAAAKAQFDIFSDSVRVSWAQLNNLTEHKLTTTEQLLNEVKATGRADAGRLSTFSQRVAALRRLRPEQQSLTDNARLTEFDATQDSVYSPLARLAAPGGEAPTEKIRDLVEAMQQDDAEEVGLRIRYDRFAKLHNNYLQLHGETLRGLGGKYATVQPLPLFELPQQ